MIYLHYKRGSEILNIVPDNLEMEHFDKIIDANFKIIVSSSQLQSDEYSLYMKINSTEYRKYVDAFLSLKSKARDVHDMLNWLAQDEHDYAFTRKRLKKLFTEEVILPEHKDFLNWVSLCKYHKFIYPSLFDPFIAEMYKENLLILVKRIGFPEDVQQVQNLVL
jgi:hypothetical protein